MTIVDYLEMFSNDSANPCYYLDYETSELVFMNQSMQKNFKYLRIILGKNVVKLNIMKTNPVFFARDYKRNTIFSLSGEFIVKL